MNRADDHVDLPARLAAHIAGLPRPLVIALDVDGTLAPLVEHPSASELVPGIDGHLRAIAELEGVVVAVVSGRQWRDLEQQFGFPAEVVVVGSHGLEFGTPGLELGTADARRRAELAALATEVAESVPGAWVEHKPAGVALHVRQAADDAADAAIERFVARLRALGDFDVLPGNAVVEVALHRYDKGEAVARLREEHDAKAVVFMGDDVTDELGFARLEPGDVGVKIGDGPTSAAHRLATPADVGALLAALAATAD